MTRLCAVAAAVCVLAAAGMAQTGAPKYQKLTITEKFYCEGAYFGDFNKDGKMDVVSGPFWYEGPDFQKKHEYRPVKEYQPTGYSDNFLTFCADFNGDGWMDVFCVPFPGAEGFWFENNQGKDGPWPKHSALKGVDGESPCWGDVNGDGRPELICCNGGFYGYATYDPAKGDQPWKFVPVTPKGRYSRYAHGQGFGDINGDGKVDLLESGAWWEQPKEAKAGEPWVRHAYPFAGAAAQLLVYDVDGDGLNDVVTAVQCHGYGLVWHKQVRDEKGQISFKQNVILPPNPDLKGSELRISQLHALEVADVNGDGVPDVLTGKRFWAHGPKGDKEPSAPAVVYWFIVNRDKAKGVTFTPVMVDDNSGVGTQVAACDLNGDKVPDVIVGNKKGTFIFLSK